MDYPDEEKQWFTFRDVRRRERVLEWLREDEIEPVAD